MHFSGSIAVGNMMFFWGRGKGEGCSEAKNPTNLTSCRRTSANRRSTKNYGANIVDFTDFGNPEL